MCGRFSRFTGIDIIESRFGVDQNILEVPLTKSYNIAPSTDVPVVRRKNPIVLQDMQWGFIPFFFNSRNPQIQPINARKDSLHKNMYKYSFENKRLLVPPDGFFEWKKTEFGKIPQFIRPIHQDVFAFAGIYSTWKPKDKTL